MFSFVQIDLSIIWEWWQYMRSSQILIFRNTNIRMLMSSNRFSDKLWNHFFYARKKQRLQAKERGCLVLICSPCHRQNALRCTYGKLTMSSIQDWVRKPNNTSHPLHSYWIQKPIYWITDHSLARIWLEANLLSGCVC